MKFEKWMPPLMALLCLAVAAMYWVLGADAASDPVGRPWYLRWYMGVVGMEVCVIVALVFIRTWLEGLRDDRRYRTVGLAKFLPAVIVASVLASAACGHNRLTNPDGTEARVTSNLGFHIEAFREYLEVGGAVTQQHADLADRWWTSLMADLRRNGFSEQRTDPTRNVQWVFILLARPRGSDSNIQCPMHNQLVGGCYDQFKPGLHVPGDYTDPDGWLGARPASQPLKHEMTHHWCLRVLGHLCMPDGKHEFTLPTGVNVWDLQWYDGYPPAAAAALSKAHASERCQFSGVQ